MHLLALKRETYEKHPHIGPALFKAFCESKAIAFKRMRNLAALRYMLPWLGDDLDELDEVFGDDPWPYGVEANRVNLDAMMQYMVEQGILKAVMPVESLFVPV
jgi:4,5-dihydroxyphthalate decarboxylase